MNSFGLSTCKNPVGNQMYRFGTKEKNGADGKHF